MEGDRLEQLVTKVAKEELREDENTRKQSLEQFRDWVIKNSDIRGCRTDDLFLLGYLRTRKFSVPMAEQMLINYLIFMENFKDVFHNVDVKDPKLDDVISSGFNFVSPFRDDDGRLVVLGFPNNVDFKNFAWESVLTNGIINMHCAMEDEVTQVTGVTYVLNLADVKPEIYTFMPLSVLYNMAANLEKAIPLRHKAIYAINPSAMGSWLLNMLTALLPQKLKDRVKILKSVEDLHKVLNPKVLPKELGGTMPAAAMVELWKQKLVANQENILSMKKVKLVGESFKVKQDVDGVGGIAGSFKKLDID